MKIVIPSFQNRDRDAKVLGGQCDYTTSIQVLGNCHALKIMQKTTTWTIWICQSSPTRSGCMEKGVRLEPTYLKPTTI